MTLHGLADGLPAEFSRHPRTIRRDLEALEAAGFPLLTDKVDGRGVVWKLMEGFRRVPALAFSPTELMALTFSRGLLRPLEGTQLQAALDSALTQGRHGAAGARPRLSQAPGQPLRDQARAPQELPGPPGDAGSPHGGHQPEPNGPDAVLLG